MSETILEIKNLNVKFGQKEIISNLSFKVKREDFMIVLGPNGAGKTTLFKAILGLIPSEGEISWQRNNWQGQTLPTLTRNKLPKIGYLPQRLNQEKFNNFPILVREFFRFKEKSDEKIIAALKSVGLEAKEVLDKSPGELSAGQFQRMLVAWSLISEPEVLFFDEPASGVDIGGEETIYSLLKKFWLKKGLTILLITHELDIIYKYATNVLCLRKKGVSCFGPPKDILTPEALKKVYGPEIKFYQHTRK